MTQATITIHSTDEEIAAAKTTALVALYNAHAAKQVKKFRDHQTAVNRVTKLLDELFANTKATDDEPEAYLPQAPIAVEETAPLAKRRVVSDAAKAEISGSFKLDRETIELTSGEVFPHAGKVWTMYSTEWMTYAQHDKLTKTLYSAAKAGQRAEYEVNGRVFALTAFATEEELEGSEDCGGE